MRRAGFSKKFLKQYQEALRQHSTQRFASSGQNSATFGHTFAQLQAEARAGVFRLKDAHSSLQAEIQEMRESIPLLVRSIWGAHSGAILSTMRQRQANVSKLISQWQDAEHRLIAVANSLTHLQTGQKLIAVGGPLAAAHLLGSTPATAQCYQAQANSSSRSTLLEGSLTLGQLNALVSRLAEEITLLQRAVYLFVLFIPMLVTAPVLLLSDKHRENWLKLMIWTIERAGPAFIKWGQWAATRADLFSPQVVASLQRLQTNAPCHSFKHTKNTVEAAFNLPLYEIFATFDEEPVASGSIAQVYRAQLTPLGAQLAQHDADNVHGLKLGGLIPFPRRVTSRREAITFADGATVAVKVRHPGVSELMETDFKLMKRAASIIGALPGGSGPQLKESLMQFGAPMREQMDLTVEAAALTRFADNFKWWSGVRFPLPAAPTLVAPDVLVESFETGKHISDYLNNDNGEYAHSKRLAFLGMSCYLKMLLRDNYIHADLHPGNILVSVDSPSKASSPRNGDGSSEQTAKTGVLSKLNSALGWNLTLPRLVLLDVGMTARLSNDDQRNLVGFFSALAAMDGGGLADSILKFSEQDAANPSGFKSDMTALFDTLEPDYMRENSQQVIGWIMDTIRNHGVHLKGVVSSVVCSSMVLEGWSTKLNPDIRIVETLKEILPSEWKTRAQAAVDKVVENQLMLTTMA